MPTEKDESLRRKIEITPGDWNDIELLIQSANYQIAAVRRTGQGAEGLERTLELLRKQIDVITWNNADDLEDWELEEEAAEEEEEESEEADEKQAETCVVKLELSQEDRKAILDLVAALKRQEKGRSES